MDNIIGFPPSRPVRPAAPLARTPLPLPHAARVLIRLAIDHLDAGGRRGIGEARAVLGIALCDLDRGIATSIEEALDPLGEGLLLALGPRTTVAEISGARRVLGLLLTVLPPGIGGARP